MNLSVKEFPDEVVKKLRLEAVNTDVTLREVIVRVLAEYAGVGQRAGGRVKGEQEKTLEVGERIKGQMERLSKREELEDELKF